MTQLTRREQFAMAAMQGFLSKPDCSFTADYLVAFADEVIAELDKTASKPIDPEIANKMQMNACEHLKIYHKANPANGRNVCLDCGDDILDETHESQKHVDQFEKMRKEWGPHSTGVSIGVYDEPTCLSKDATAQSGATGGKIDFSGQCEHTSWHTIGYNKICMDCGKEL